MNSTEDRIIHSALTLFSNDGISKTSVNDIAYHAGVTRITVYRHFSDKEALVREAYLLVEQVFQEALIELQRTPSADWRDTLQQIGDHLSSLPSQNVFARFDELKRLYPEVYRSIQDIREHSLNGIFEYIFEAAENQNLLRSDLNRPMVQAIYWKLVITLFDNAELKSFDLSSAELYNTMTDLFLHGILTN